MYHYSLKNLAVTLTMLVECDGIYLSPSPSLGFFFGNQFLQN